MSVQPASTELQFKSKDGFELSGVLEMPEKADGPVPIVILHPGSGPTDRDGNQPQFKLVTDLMPQLAKRLNEHGVATFRFDKRAAWVYKDKWPKSPSEYGSFFGWENHLNDYTAAVETARHAPGIDPDRVTLLGHSEGGVLSLAIADKVKARSLILLGTPGRPFEVIIREQISALLDRQTRDPEVKKAYLAEVDANCKLIKDEKRVADKVSPGLKALFNDSVADFLQGEMKFDLAAAARSFAGPVLVVNGEKDAQVSAVRDATPLSQYFGKLDKLVIVPDASHVLKTLASDTDTGFAGPVAAPALDAIGEFADRVLKS